MKNGLILLFVCLSLAAAPGRAEEDFVGLPPPGELREFLKPPAPSSAQAPAQSEAREAPAPRATTPPATPASRTPPPPARQAAAGSATPRQPRNTAPAIPPRETAVVTPAPRSPAVLRVGPGSRYSLPSMAARLAQDGDTIEIDAAGNYEGDEAVWSANRLHIRGIGGRPHIHSNRPLKNRKALWIIRGAGITVENIEFSGAKTPDRNAAGIRQEGPGLVIRNCYFHHNEMGILVNNDAKLDTLIEYSEFYDNSLGANRPQKGRIGHNIYIGRSASFTLRYSYVHHGRVGHNVKSRSRKNLILYNRIMDEREGRASYQIDFPDGGLAYVIGNLIQQGEQAENWALIAYALESLRYPDNALLLVNNTLVNDRRSGQFVNLKRDIEHRYVNNIFAGKGKLPDDARLKKTNLVRRNPAFVDRDAFDYRLRAGSAAIDRGAVPGKFRGVDLMPTHEYRHRAKSALRPFAGPLDYGALEFRP